MHKPLQRLKTGIWIYFVLLLIEGGLRRWFLPSLAAPLLVVRDPLAIYLLFVAYKFDVFPKHKLVPLMFYIGILSILTALIFGHGNFFVALFGARVLLIQFPMLYLIGRNFEREDVILMGKIILWISIPMAILMTIQFYSPQTAWVNRGVGDSTEGAGFSGINDYFRPPGTFSFITGLTSFFSLAACFIFYFWLQPKYVNKLLLIGATLALIVSIPTSIARTLFFQVLITLIFFLIAKSSMPGFLKNMIQLAFGIAILIFLFSNIDTLNTQIGAFSERFSLANESEGGLGGVIVDRFLGGFVGAFIILDDNHVVFGHGIGMGTNVGAQLLSGKTDFLIAEQEWGRIIGESGMLIGLLIIVIRIKMTSDIAIHCFRRFKEGDYLPWMLLSFGILVLFQGGWAQPNNLGFYVLVGGLILATLSSPLEKDRKRQKKFKRG